MTPPRRRAAIGLLSLATVLTTATATAAAGQGSDVAMTRQIAGATIPGAVGAGHSRSATIRRGGHDARVSFSTRHRGEAFLRVGVSAKRVSWAKPHAESAIVSISVDGHDASDIVIFGGTPVEREIALGTLGKGRHVLRAHYVRRSPKGAGAATLRKLDVRVVRPRSPEYAVDRYAPVLYGRNVPDVAGPHDSYQGPYQNAVTDTPLVAFHRVLPASRPGHRVIEYSVIWSNEDGGTYTPMLMAQWGRTTDIEWIYRVEVNAHGHRVPGTGVYQSAYHGTMAFRGTYDGTHPLLQTCTTNNNVCDAIDDPMRFALSARGVLPRERPRETVMDRNPWTYRVMSQELVREQKIVSPPSPTSSAMGNPRAYLYLAVDHATVPSGAASGVGVAVDVTLRGDPTVYSSNHDIPAWSINRDGAQATTVELPPGTTRADIATISVRRVPILTDNGAAVVAVALTRGFFLGRNYLPGRPFLTWAGNVTLTPESPTAQVYPAG